MIDAINNSINDGDERRNIIMYVAIKKAKLPSSDLLNNRVVPYLMPTRAAAESDNAIIIRAIMTTFSLNR